MITMINLNSLSPLDYDNKTFEIHNFANYVNRSKYVLKCQSKIAQRIQYISSLQ